MDPEKQELLAAEPQTPGTTQPAENNAPTLTSTKLDVEPLTYESKRDMISILQKIPVAPPEWYRKNAVRRYRVNIARSVIFFILWIVQSSYVFKEIGKPLYWIVKRWMVKNCGRHAEKAAFTAAAAAASSEDATYIWKTLLVTIPVMILIWVLLTLLVRPLTSTGRHIFFEGCTACFCVFQANSAGLVVFIRYMDKGVKDYYNMFNSTMFLALLCLTAVTSVSYLKEVELTTYGIGAFPTAAASNSINEKGDSQV